ncbi:peptidase S8 [Paenibacillus thalictri]|uniref:Peptidase S8 n=2 Tax=Paenibacillus thalictri TaxID=2527873 RepID=A0A4Q9DJ29_9BACL|nr:peptidase S8 [Paenibacillus thalictri]
MKAKLSSLRSVQCLKIINAISCTLRPNGQLLHSPYVHSVETDVKIRVHGLKSFQPLQARAVKAPAEQMIPWGIRHIKAPQVWNKAKGAQIHIGVIDTGVDYSHPDLRHALSRGINLIQRHLLPADDNGHGTHIAGTIAAASRQRGITGVAPQAVIHPVKAFDYQGSAYVSDIIQGIDWCVKNGLHIVNMSFGMKTYSRSLEAAVKNAYQAGTIVVASSGNEGKKTSIDYPARFPQTISVGATTKTSRIARFSNRGKHIDIYAPGDKIYSTWLKGKYTELSGTSMATSHVSGVIALMLSTRPTLRPYQVKSILKKHAVKLARYAKLQKDIREVHALRAVQAVLKAKRSV